MLWTEFPLKAKFSADVLSYHEIESRLAPIVHVRTGLDPYLSQTKRDDVYRWTSVVSV